jgi:arginine utilization protein RocB
VEQDWAALGARAMALAGRLVATPSVHGTAGEAQVIGLLAEQLRAGLADALSAGRAELQVVDVERPAQDGSGPAKALLAWLAPPAGSGTATALALLGHLDTVEESAKCRVQSAEREGHDNPPPASTLHPAPCTSHWLHGRGWLDMQGGAAVITELFLQQARAAADAAVPAHLLLLLTTDEEDASRGVYALLPALREVLTRRGLTLAGVFNADYSEPAAGAAAEPRGAVYAGTAGKLLLGVSVCGLPAHACAPGAGLNAAALAGHIAAGLEGLPRLAVQAGPQRLPPPRVLSLTDERSAYNVTTPAQAQLYVNVLHAGHGLPELWRRCLREVRELAREFSRTQRRRARDWARQTGAAELPEPAPRPVVLDYAALAKAAQAAGVAADPGPLDTIHAAEAEPRAAALAHVAALAAGLRTRAADAAPWAGRPLVVLTLLPPFYPGGRVASAAPLQAALAGAAKRHGVALLPLYPYIADASAFCWTAPNTALAAQAPLFPPADSRGAWGELAAPVCNIGPVGYGAHGPDERVYAPYLRDVLPRLLWDALLAAARPAPG